MTPDPTKFLVPKSYLKCLLMKATILTLFTQNENMNLYSPGTRNQKILATKMTIRSFMFGMELGSYYFPTASIFMGFASEISAYAWHQYYVKSFLLENGLVLHLKLLAFP